MDTSLNAHNYRADEDLTHIEKDGYSTKGQAGGGKAPCLPDAPSIRRTGTAIATAVESHLESQLVHVEKVEEMFMGSDLKDLKDLKELKELKGCADAPLWRLDVVDMEDVEKLTYCIRIVVDLDTDRIAVRLRRTGGDGSLFLTRVQSVNAILQDQFGIDCLCARGQSKTLPPPDLPQLDDPSEEELEEILCIAEESLKSMDMSTKVEGAKVMRDLVDSHGESPVIVQGLQGDWSLLRDALLSGFDCLVVQVALLMASLAAVTQFDDDQPSSSQGTSLVDALLHVVTSSTAVQSRKEHSASRLICARCCSRAVFLLVQQFGSLPEGDQCTSAIESASTSAALADDPWVKHYLSAALMTCVS